MPQQGGQAHIAMCITELVGSLDHTPPSCVNTHASNYPPTYSHPPTHIDPTPTSNAHATVHPQQDPSESQAGASGKHANASRALALHTTAQDIVLLSVEHAYMFGKRMCWLHKTCICNQIVIGTCIHMPQSAVPPAKAIAMTPHASPTHAGVTSAVIAQHRCKNM